MRVGYFAMKFPYGKEFDDYGYGGAARAAFNLALNVARHGHKVNVFTTSRDSKKSLEETENMTIHRYPTNFKLLSSNISVKLLCNIGLHQLDIVHTHFDIPPGPAGGLRYANKNELPHVVTYHGDWDDTYGGLLRRVGVKACNAFVAKRLLDRATTIISPSETYARRSRFLRKHLEKTRIVPIGIDLSKFESTESREESRSLLGLPGDVAIILFLGFLSRYKSPDILARAMCKVMSKYPDAILVFAGKGEMENQLASLSRELGIFKNVKFTGYVDDRTKRLYYKSADVFCLPSTLATECYPATILEAMAIGTPVVATDIGGIPDLVEDRKTGLLVEPGDVDGLSSSILDIISDRSVGEDFARNAKEKVGQLGWDRIARMTEAIYEDASAGG